MKVLGVDNGRRTGYAIVEDKKFILANHFITGAANMSIEQKIANHYNLLRSVILKNAPDCIVVETPNDMTGRDKVMLSRAYYASTVILASEYNVPLIGCHAMTLKKAITGSGKAEKVNVCDYLVKHYGVPRSEIEIPVYYTASYKKDTNGNMLIKEYLYDESDATALAYYYFIKED